ncbi:hypothetical protein ILUMI_17758, partial [Ignelater luminosus]
EQLSSSNIEIIASESPIALESSEQLDHGLSYSEEINEAEMDNETIKNNEYTPNAADEDNDHPAIEDKEDDDCIPLETNASSDDNSSSTGNDEKAKIMMKQVEKKKRAGAEEYLSSKNKIVKKKEVRQACSSESCKMKCTQKITEADRQRIHKDFWNSENSNHHKRQFVCSSIEEKPIQRARCRNPEFISRRTHSLQYYVTLNGNKTRTRQSSGVAESDLRGKHQPANKLSENTRNKIREHIAKFSVIESHYSQDCQNQGMRNDDDISKQWLYAHIFNTEFNLGFKPPATDTCDMCDEYQILLKEASDVNQQTSVQEKYEKHLAEVQQRYQTKKADKETAKQNAYQKVVMVDLEKCLPSPVLANSPSFYSLKLWSFNYTIYDTNEKVSNCMWDESIAGRGGNEMASCMLKYISSLNDSRITHLIVWSDNCPSQNRNVQMIMCYFHILRTVPHLKTDFDETSEFEAVDYNRKVSRNNTIYDDLDQVTEEKHPISKKNTMTCRN